MVQARSDDRCAPRSVIAAVDPLPGQMDVWECIAVAERGLDGRPPAAVLDLHKGISPPTRIPDPRAGRGCLRWPEHQRLLNIDTGELIMGRCKATNLCPYCRILAVIETAEMLLLDAMEHAPTLLMTLTAREHLSRKDTHRHLEHALRSARRRWPVQWHVQVEFQKRGALHLHLLVKGVPVDVADQLLDTIASVWCRRVDAERPGQSVKEISGAQGIVRYLQKELAHGLKQEQAPPLGWRGHRTSQTRGYLVRPARVMREEARQSLRLGRALWRAHQSGYEGEAAEIVAQAEGLDRAAQEWRMYALNLRSPDNARLSPDAQA